MPEAADPHAAAERGRHVTPVVAGGVSDELLKLGLPGVAIFCLGVAVIYLARKYDRAKSEAAEAQKTAAAHAEDLLEKRRVEQVELMKLLMETVDRNTEAFTEQSEGFKALRTDCTARFRK